MSRETLAAQFGCAVFKWKRVFFVIYSTSNVMFLVLPSFAILAMNACIIYKLSGNSPLESTGELKRKEQNRQLTIVLILISLSYIVLYFPLMVKRFLKDFTSALRDPTGIVEICTDTLYISGFAINFYLYSMESKLFRDELKKMFCRESPSHNTSND